MASRSLYHILFLLLPVLKCMPGQNVKGSAGIEVNIWEEEVTVTWQPPEDVPKGAKYLVRLSRPNDPPVNVTTCEALTHCVISDYITNYTSRYFVSVSLILHGQIIWKKKKPFTMAESKLRPPVFSLTADSGLFKVKVLQKPKLPELHKYGVKYTFCLHTRKDGQTIQEKQMTYDMDNPVKDIIFGDGLPLDQEYCMRVTVESNSIATKNISEQCINLTSDQFTITTVVIIAVVVSIVVLSMNGICYFLCHPAKTPKTLKPFGSDWKPLSIDQTPVEVIIPNGWLLTRSTPEGKKEMSEDKMAILQEEESRRSLDSGVSLVASSTSGDAAMSRRDGRQEDSGCGSLGSVAENESDHGESRMLPLLEGRNKCNGVVPGEDSGLGLGFNSEPAGGSEGEDSRSLPDVEVTTGDCGYRSQSPSAVVVVNNSQEVTLPQALPETDFDMAAPVVGYRPSHVTVHYGETPTDTIEQDLPVSSYLRKTQTVEAAGLLSPLSFSCEISQPSLIETPSFIVSLPQLLLDEKAAESGLTTLPLLLSDMELTFG